MLAILAQGGPWGLVTLIVVSIVTGWLIPRWTHLERIRDLKEYAAELKAALAVERKRGDEYAAQVTILLGRVREPTS